MVEAAFSFVTPRRAPQPYRNDPTRGNFIKNIEHENLQNTAPRLLDELTGIKEFNVHRSNGKTALGKSIWSAPYSMQVIYLYGEAFLETSHWHWVSSVLTLGNLSTKLRELPMK